MKKLTLSDLKQSRNKLLSKVPRFIENQKMKRKFGADKIRSTAIKTKHFSRLIGMEDLVNGYSDEQCKFDSMLEGYENPKSLFQVEWFNNTVKQEVDDPSYLENDNIIIIVKDEYMLESNVSFCGGVENEFDIANDSMEEKVVSNLEALFRNNGKAKQKRKKYKQIRDLIERPGINYKYGKKSGTFLCHICGELKTARQTTTFRKHLKRHEEMEANLRRYKCFVCGKAFNLNSSLRIHKLKVHDKERLESLKHVCSVCGERSLSKEHILACEASHSYIDPPTPFQCHCGESFISQHKLVVHKNHKHRNKYPKVHNSVKWCKTCSQDFFSASELDKHKQTVHGKQITQKCPVCARELANIFSLALHLKNLHGITNPSKEKTIKCLACNKSFVMFASFVKHTRDRHVRELGAEEILQINEEIHERYGGMKVENEETPLREKEKRTCPLCLKELATALSLNNHFQSIHKIRSLSRSKSFCCGICGRGFIMLSSYIYHKAKAHKEQVKATELEAMNSVLTTESPEAHLAQKEWICAHCGKVFKNKSGLKTHEYNVHRTKDIKCVYCKETFESRPVYYEHKYEAHTPFERKVCLLCNKQFRSYGAHWAHKYVHTTPSHGCDHCGSIFKRKGDLTRHLREKHGIITAPASLDAPKLAIYDDPDEPNPTPDAEPALEYKFEDDVDGFTWGESDALE